MSMPNAQAAVDMSSFVRRVTGSLKGGAPTVIGLPARLP